MSRAEKFISDCTRNCSNECCGEGINVGHGVTLSKRCYTPWLTPDQARRAVEIARQEMIEKPCEYLDLHCNDVKTEDNGIAGWIDNEFINNFRQVMKDE